MDQGRSERVWMPPVLTAVTAVALGLSTNVASSLVPKHWSETHAVWVWSVTGAFALATLVLGVRAARDPGQAKSFPAGDVEVEESPGSQMVGAGGVLDASITIGDAGGSIVIAQQGAQVTINPAPAAPAPLPVAGQVVVGDLPGAPASFVTRDAIDRLAETLRAGRVAVVCAALTGGRGVGKTQVAAEYARQQAGAGIPLVAWVSAETSDNLLSGLAEVAAALGVADPEGDSEKSAKNLRARLQTWRVAGLLVLDNAAVAPELLRSFVPSSGSVSVVVTSTDRAFAALGAEIDVSTFDRPQSLAFLLQRTGLDDSAGAGRVAEELGDLPLALAQAAALIRRRNLSFGEYLVLLGERPLAAVLPAERGSAYPRGAGRVIVLSVEDVESGQAQAGDVVLFMAFMAAEGVSRDLLDDLGVVDGPEQLDRVLDQLLDASLLNWARGEQSVVMHRLVARAIRDRAQSRGALGSELSRVASALKAVLIPEEKAWGQRQRGNELVEHATRLWAIAVAAPRGMVTQQEVADANVVASWAVRHLITTADLARAITLGINVQDSTERVLGGDHPDTLASRNNLAYAYESAGDLGKAIPLYEATLAERERVLGGDHPSTLASRNNLAGAYESAGNLGKAILVYKATLASRQRVLGADHVDTLMSQNDLAYTYKAAGNFGKAIPLFEAALAGFQRVLGADHPDTLASRNNLAGAYGSAGDLAKATTLYEATFVAYERVLGTDHPDTLMLRNNLAGTYESAGDLGKAVVLYEETLAAGMRVLGADHPQTLILRNNLAYAYESAGETEKAVVLYEATLADRQRVLGADHPDTMMSSHNLAAAYAAAQDLEKAIPLFEATVADRQRVLGADHPDTLASRNNLARAYESVGDVRKAIPLYEATLADCERVLSPGHPMTGAVRANLAAARGKM